MLLNLALEFWASSQHYVYIDTVHLENSAVLSNLRFWNDNESLLLKEYCIFTFYFIFFFKAIPIDFNVTEWKFMVKFSDSISQLIF